VPASQCGRFLTGLPLDLTADQDTIIEAMEATGS
jgi:hypothetical protein